MIEFDEESEKEDTISPSRFRNIAVRYLGYSQSEAGFRSVTRIVAELEDLNSMTKNKNSNNALNLIDKEMI